MRRGGKEKKRRKNKIKKKKERITFLKIKNNMVK